MSFPLTSSNDEVAALDSHPQSAHEEVHLDLVVDRLAILRALSHIHSVVEKKTTIPILSNIMLVTTERGITLTATDMDIMVTEEVEAQVTQAGKVTVPAHMLYDIIRKLPDEMPVALQVNKQTGSHLSIRAGSCHFTLPWLPAREFPVMDAGTMSHTFTLTSADMRVMLDKTRFAISTEETRYFLNGIYLHCVTPTPTDPHPLLPPSGGLEIRAVSTDGHRLAMVTLPAPTGVDSALPSVIIPRKTVMELFRLLEGWEGEVHIRLSSVKVEFACNKVVLVSKVIDGTFPDYMHLIPRDNQARLALSTEGFAKAVDRVSTISLEKSRGVKCTLSPGKLIVAASAHAQGSASEELPASYENEEMTIGFNARYILDLMAVITDPQVEVFMHDTDSPVIVRDKGESRALYLLMPMRM